MGRPDGPGHQFLICFILPVGQEYMGPNKGIGRYPHGGYGQSPYPPWPSCFFMMLLLHNVIEQQATTPVWLLRPSMVSSYTDNNSPSRPSHGRLPNLPVQSPLPHIARHHMYPHPPGTVSARSRLKRKGSPHSLTCFLPVIHIIGEG